MLVGCAADPCLSGACGVALAGRAVSAGLNALVGEDVHPPTVPRLFKQSAGFRRVLARIAEVVDPQRGNGIQPVLGPNHQAAVLGVAALARAFRGADGPRSQEVLYAARPQSDLFGSRPACLRLAPISANNVLTSPQTHAVLHVRHACVGIICRCEGSAKRRDRITHGGGERGGSPQARRWP
jgi:hypothetical protein